MMCHRFYLSPRDGELSAGMTVELSGQEARHAARVLRLREGDEIEIFDGRGNVFRAILQNVQPRSVSAEIISSTSLPPLTRRVTVALCVPKGKRAAACVETLTELGADAIIPLETERSVARGGDIDKWRDRALEACKQSRRAWLPEIADLTPLAELCTRFDDWQDVFLASLAETAIAPASLGDQILQSRGILWLVGPEGGFTPAEEELMFNRGAQPVRLNPHVLRIATAAELCVGLSRFWSASK